jgi:nicotinamidase-related amidase
MLMNSNESSLLVVDVQERLAPAVHQIEQVTANCIWLAGVAARMGVPIVVSEHCPDKLGPTLASVKAATTSARYLAKQYFSVQGDHKLDGTAVAERPQVVICGIEAHVCVLQTAIDLRNAGKAVFVVADASSSRVPQDRDLAFARLRDHGIEVVSREMVVFEWLERAGTDLFRAVSREFIR